MSCSAAIEDGFSEVGGVEASGDERVVVGHVFDHQFRQLGAHTDIHLVKGVTVNRAGFIEERVVRVLLVVLVMRLLPTQATDATKKRGTERAV